MCVLSFMDASMLAITISNSVMRTAAAPILVCRTCATNNEGRPTCCSKGGSWYLKCGDAGEYTWAQGFQACKNAGSGVEALGQAKLTQNDIQNQSIDSTDATKSNYKDPTELTLFAVLLLFALYLQA